MTAVAQRSPHEVTQAVSAKDLSARPAGEREGMEARKPIAVVTCLFNPWGWESRHRNYERFRDSVRSAGCPLYCVELVYGDAGPVCDADVKIELRGDEANVLWQKEALLSIGLAKAISDGHEFIGWFDADVVIPSDWGQLAVSALSAQARPAILHAASHWARHFSGGVRERWQSALLAPNRPFVGGGWLAHADLWRSTRLFDMCIVGGGDWALAVGYLAACGRTITSPWSHVLKCPRIQKLWKSWCEGIPSVTDAAAVPANITLLPHGSRSRRGYDKRLKLLNGYYPSRDIRRRSDGVLEWTNANPQLQDKVRQYFVSRREDG